MLLSAAFAGAAIADRGWAAETAPFASTQAVGEVSLKATHIRVSVPLRIARDSATAAIEELRRQRRVLEERALELGGDPESVRAIAFECIPEEISRVAMLRNREQPRTPRQVACCFLIADFPVPQVDDDEALLAVAQTILRDLLVDQPEENDRVSIDDRRYYSSTLDVRRLDGPIALFAAQPTEEEVGRAYRQALDLARQDLELMAEVAGLPLDRPLRPSWQRRSSSSTLRPHPVAQAIGLTDPAWSVSTFPDGLRYRATVSLSGFTRQESE